MRRHVMWILVIAVFSAATLASDRAHAQKDRWGNWWKVKTKEAEFAQLYRQWLWPTNDLEKKIALAERALKLEPALKGWPLHAPREHVTGELWYSVGVSYHNRRHGVRADNLEKAIAAYEASLTVRSREASPQDWADTQYNLGVAYDDRISRFACGQPGEGDCGL